MHYDCGEFSGDPLHGEPFVWDHANERCKMSFGRTYAVVPKRGHAAVLWNPDHPCNVDALPAGDEHYALAKSGAWDYTAQGYRQLRIRITSIRCERLQDISEDDARAEGVADVAAYRELWERINGAGSWDANPFVWVYGFEVVR